MGGTIKIDKDALQKGGQLLMGDLSDFCSMRLAPLSGPLPVGGSADHDGRLTYALVGALESYRAIVSEDAASLRGLGETMLRADEAAAASMRVE